MPQIIAMPQAKKRQLNGLGLWSMMHLRTGRALNQKLADPKGGPALHALGQERQGLTSHAGVTLRAAG
jgi:hypothetical protein